MIEKPTKVFPCDCMGEGLVVVREDESLDDCEGAPFIEIGFWVYGQVTRKRNWRWRLRTCWHTLREGTCWTDMVIFKKKTARNFANHILYLLNKKPKVDEKDYLVKEDKAKAKFGLVLAEDSKEPQPEPKLVEPVPLSLEDISGAEKGMIEMGFKKVEEPYPIAMLCVQHGGSPDEEKYNAKHGLKCPKCAQFDNGAHIEFDI